jgi:hypothetical protein
MAEKLSEEIKAVLQRYYMHRERQSRDGWNKAEDLKVIFEAAKQEGWSTQAVAGHFWFSKKSLIARHIIEVSEETLSEGGISNIQALNKPFGALYEIADAVRKTGREPEFYNANAYADPDEAGE